MPILRLFSENLFTSVAFSSNHARGLLIDRDRDLGLETKKINIQFERLTKKTVYDIMNITYREAKMILAKQEEAREVINSYRGMETLGKRLQLKNNKELILKLFEIEEDDSVVEVFTHLKVLYEEQWGDAEATAPPAFPGVVEEDSSDDSSKAEKSKDSVEETVAVE